MKTLKQIIQEIKGGGVPLMKGPLGPRMARTDIENKPEYIRQTLGMLQQQGKPRKKGGRGGDNPYTSAYGEFGSSRGYFRLRGHTNVKIDGTKTKMPTGMKFLVDSPEVRKYNRIIKNSGKFSRDSLGEMQNAAENGDHYVNSKYRILTQSGKRSFRTNEEDGIFPPLIDYDHHGHKWAHIGHTEDLDNDMRSPNHFKNLTKTESHPEGISHDDFMSALVRDHARRNGRPHYATPYRNRVLDAVEKHPLVQKFLAHQRETNTPPHDYTTNNLGVWTHPVTGEKHIVARDHGYSEEVAKGYRYARDRDTGETDSYSEIPSSTKGSSR